MSLLAALGERLVQLAARTGAARRTGSADRSNSSRYPGAMAQDGNDMLHRSKLDRWSGCWVALRGDEVIAAAHTSGELARQLLEKGPSAAGAVVEYVQPTSDTMVVGLG